MPRLRITLVAWPRRALVLTDTPRPHCPTCHGTAGHGHTSVHADGKFDGIDWHPCPCWDDTLRWTLLPLPHRTPPGGYSDEPPF
ncbi:hypothetical protein [Streptomyces sp. WAC08241]|uniref:hypothetical protein n=1 Tax=Streptomyces sp. WAC08241 TaxID=2487421 RepID=UPI000F7B67D2|nr:hypothetical protein [Streptomyces sp. WAC08241]RSS41640.1 hypothetical protein EF906_14030 [Streptomyces sp. WAC08241]